MGRGEGGNVRGGLGWEVGLVVSDSGSRASSGGPGGETVRRNYD